MKQIPKPTELKLFDTKSDLQNVSKSVAPFSDLVFNEGLTKDIQELTRIFTELTRPDQQKLLCVARELRAGPLSSGISDGTGFYADRHPGETAYDYIVRKDAVPPSYARRSGIVEHLRTHYLSAGLLDGMYFTRATLRKLDAGADQALQNWLRNNALPVDLLLPTRSDLTVQLLRDVELTPEQIRAATALAHRL